MARALLNGIAAIAFATMATAAATTGDFARGTFFLLGALAFLGWSGLWPHREADL